MAKLGVNVDHVATLRQARRAAYPDPALAAKLALEEGVSCITVHLREDRRHIQDADLLAIRKLPGCRLNLEMSATDEIIAIALKVRPEQVTIVPERREELTTEGGLDVAARPEFYRDLTKTFSAAGIGLSFFIDPGQKQIDACAATHAVAVEINTAAYSGAVSDKDIVKTLRDVQRSAHAARQLGLIVHAGHGLNYKNVTSIAAIDGLDELNIGHSIVAQSVYVGFPAAVASMKKLIEAAIPKKRAAAGAK
ncbi:MAG: pyridoxine 5'-phosphate synthase [Nitrospinae bacterium]|nr:pyridoxine 5'-phosphate synthase [Nitrospinota bacterium]